MKKPPISICMPTFNRARILDETLSHLVDCKSFFDFELVITDNASEDNTPQIIDKYRDQFPSLIYHRQSENIGAILNSASALNLATSELSYLFPDDDRLVPETIQKIIGMFDDSSQLVAVYGNHIEFNPYTGKEFELCLRIKEEKIFNYDSRVDMFEQYSQVWSPVFKTGISQRFNYFDETTFGLWQVVENIIKYGSIALIPDAVYKHAHTKDRMEQDLVEPWYQDCHRSDFELFIGRLGIDHSIEGITEHVIKAVSDRSVSAYVTACDFSREQEKYMLQRHYLLRARCYGLVTDEQMKVQEENFMLHWLLERVETTLKGLPDVQKIVMERSAMSEYILFLINSERFSSLPCMELCSADQLEERETDDGELLLVSDYSTIENRKIKKQGYEFSINDIISTLRVTQGDLLIKTVH